MYFFLIQLIPRFPWSAQPLGSFGGYDKWFENFRCVGCLNNISAIFTSTFQILAFVVSINVICTWLQLMLCSYYSSFCSLRIFSLRGVQFLLLENLLNLSMGPTISEVCKPLTLVFLSWREGCFLWCNLSNTCP